MSSLAVTRHGGLLFGLASPTAGGIAQELRRMTVLAVEGLKASIPAGSSSAFNDLQALAQEHSSDVHSSKNFLLALRFLLALPTYLPAPELALDEDGEVSFDWRGSGGRLLTATLREDGRLSYAARISAYDKDH